jgi:hypothetical protein
MTTAALPLTDRVGELIELSAIYFDDGAPRTAAKKLREAADLIEAEADRLEAAMRGESS